MSVKEEKGKELTKLVHTRSNVKDFTKNARAQKSKAEAKVGSDEDRKREVKSGGEEVGSTSPNKKRVLFKEK